MRFLVAASYVVCVIDGESVGVVLVHVVELDTSQDIRPESQSQSEPLVLEVRAARAARVALLVVLPLAYAVSLPNSLINIFTNSIMQYES